MDAHPPLDTAALREQLVGPWRRLDVVEETGSTNADLLARAAAGEDIDGAVLLAEHQTSGRGRHGRQWATPPRSQVALSVGVGAAAVPTTGWGWLTLATGVAVADALGQVAGIDAGLKWPNDVVVGDGKLAGILAEVAAPNPVIVIGLGLNATMTAAEAPEHTAATSLTMLGVAADRTALAAAVLRQLAARIDGWRSAGGADEALRADYRRYSATLGTRVRASMPGDRQIEGIAEAIDELGRLRIDTGAGVETVSAGDVTHLRPGV
ncbi:biotin--[acetyl-CoA-carboxylase] ligase [Mycobacterium eburneum]|nr:biotin--[acetyl-CoA-carboxylase] ligase [Mycobacterium eburneum]TDH49400.1 biotin--[acetyl-CoA-carboxylase] ligase [Mycobacterium eburneum]